MNYLRTVLVAVTLLLVFALPAWGQESPSPSPTASPSPEPTASPSPEPTTPAPVSDGACQNPVEVATLGPTTNDDRTSSRTTGGSFRVSYEVDFENDDPIDFRDFNVEINDRFGLVESDSTDRDTSASFIVPEDPGTFEVSAEVEPNNGATYTVTVEDCGAANGGNGGNGGNDGNGGDVNNPDVNNPDVNNPDKVIPDTTSKKPLPNTGGVPLLGLAIGVTALLGAGFSILRTSRRRDP